jgi:hypothetical protein
VNKTTHQQQQWRRFYSQQVFSPGATFAPLLFHTARQSRPSKIGTRKKGAAPITTHTRADILHSAGAAKNK